MSETWGFSTKLIHSGIHPERYAGATSIPIFETASYAYDTAQELADVFDGRKFGYRYSRISNPTVAAFEERMSSLESAVGAIATSAGMSAISTAVFALTEKGDEIISSKSLFGGTFVLFNKVLQKYGVKVIYVDISDVEACRKALSNKTRLVFLETIGNPKLDVPDIRKIADVARGSRIPLVIDATMTTPYLFKAGDFGADIIIHSATKYITGNGTAIGGIIIDCGHYDWKKSAVEDIRKAAGTIDPVFAFLASARRSIFQNTGCCLSPFNAYLHSLGLETLSLRMERHCTNALKLAKYLTGAPKIVNVNYPGLPGNSHRKIAESQFGNKFGGVLTFRLASRDRCFSLIDNLKLVMNLANLGDTKTLIIHPASTIYHNCTEEEMKLAGVSEDLLRVSVGLEEPEEPVTLILLLFPMGRIIFPRS